MMSPLAHTLLCAIRYAHGRSQHPYKDVIQTVRDLWSRLDPDSRLYWLDLVEAQVPSDLERMIEIHNGKIFPVTREELEEERDAYLILFRWCRDALAAENLTPVLLRHVDEMNFSVRIYNALDSGKIIYVWQLVEKTKRDLLRMKNLGRKSVGEIQQVLKGLGLSLGMQITPALLA
jgi:hypothetical protein